MSHESLARLVERHLVFDVTCRGHCSRPASFKSLSEEQGKVVGAYLCPEGFVSRVVYFGLTPDLEWFHRFLSGQLGGEMVQRRDLRVASRHGWELGEGAAEEFGRLAREGQRPVVKEVYWTRYPRTDADKRRGVFLCSDPKRGRGCGRLFVQEVTSKAKLCPQCR
jgi:hypothetical protein